LLRFGFSFLTDAVLAVPMVESSRLLRDFRIASFSLAEGSCRAVVAALTKPPLSHNLKGCCTPSAAEAASPRKASNFLSALKSGARSSLAFLQGTSPLYSEHEFEPYSMLYIMVVYFRLEALSRFVCTIMLKTLLHLQVCVLLQSLFNIAMRALRT
jgi:hypothetical protein